MSVRKILFKCLLPLMVMSAVMMVAGACGGSETPTKAAPPKEVIKFHDGNWATLWLHNAIAMYIVENGYGYPVEEVQGNTGTMKVALPDGELDVNMEIWRMNIPDWYDENVTQSGDIVDLAGSNDNLPAGSPGQSLVSGGQGFYVSTYTAEENPGLVSVDDLPQYAHLFADPEDPEKGLLLNCIAGWQCSKINRAKWAAYGLNDTYNVLEPGSGPALDAAIEGAYLAGEPVLTYYWEPTSLLNRLDMTRIDEPVWTQDCQDVMDAAVEDTPFESEVGCGYPFGDVHIGVHKSLVDRAPEVTELLSKVFVGAKALGELETYKNDNDVEWRDAGIYWLQNNEDAWTEWVSSDIATTIKAALNQEGA